MKNLNIHLGVKKLADVRCDKRNVVEILKKYYNFDETIEKDKKALILGALLHSIVQITFKSRINEIEYHFFVKYNKEKPLNEVIYEVLKNTLKTYQEIAEFKFNNNDNEFSEEIFDSTIISSRTYLRKFANLSLEYIICEENSIKSNYIEDELTINWLIDEDFQIKGKVDLICKKDDVIHLIEIKSGKIYDKDKFQLQLYGEVLKKQYPNSKFKLFLWTPKNSTKAIPVSIPTTFTLINKITEQKNIAQKIINKKYKFKDLKTNKDICDKTYCEICEDQDLLNKINMEISGGTLSKFLM